MHWIRIFVAEKKTECAFLPSFLDFTTSRTRNLSCFASERQDSIFSSFLLHAYTPCQQSFSCYTYVVVLSQAADVLTTVLSLPSSARWVEKTGSVNARKLIGQEKGSLICEMWDKKPKPNRKRQKTSKANQITRHSPQVKLLLGQCLISQPPSNPIVPRSLFSTTTFIFNHKVLWYQIPYSYYRFSPIPVRPSTG